MFGRSLLASVVLTIPAILAAPGPIQADAGPFNVVVTIPVLKEFAERVGGPHVRVMSLLSGVQNEHTYSPKPSDLIAVHHAKVLIEVGMGLEVWVASLVKNAGHADLIVVTTSQRAALLAAMASDTHRHTQGNPHIWLDPENAKLMVQQITQAFARVDPAHAGTFGENEAIYLRQITALENELTERLKPVTDRRIVVHHPAWPYFARRFGFDVVDEIITQSGAEPSVRHVQALAGRIRREHIRVIVSEPQLNQDLPRVLAQESGARLVVLTAMPGGLPGTDTYLDMLRYNVMKLAEALESKN